MRAKAGSKASSEPVEFTEDIPGSPEQPLPPAMGEDGHGELPESVDMDIEARSSVPPTRVEKRKARSADLAPRSSKKQRTDTIVSQKEKATTVLSRLSASPDEATVTASVPMPVVNEGMNETNSMEVDSIRNAIIPPSHPKAAQQLPTPPANTNASLPLPLSLPPGLVQPSASSLEPHARTIHEHYMNRAAPGLYVNPFARHKARGRPRKVYIVTFKLPRLQEFDWFKPDPSPIQDTHKSPDTAVPKASAKIDTQPTEQHKSSAGALDNGALLRSDIVSQPTSLINAQELRVLPQDGANADGQSFVTARVASPKSDMVLGIPNNKSDGQEQPKAHTESASSEPQPLTTTALASDHGDVHGQPQSDLERLREPAEKVSVLSQADKEAHSEQQSAQQLPTATADEEPKALTSVELSVQHPLLGRRSDAQWAAVNVSRLHSPAPYQSPYGPTPPPQTTPNVISSNVSDFSTPGPRTPLDDGNDNASLPEGVYSAISEVPAPPAPKQKARAKSTNPMGGSGLLFRRQIIREIIDLCKGVFPDGGEINRPFHKLWVERHGHKENVKEPITSTVMSTLRNMCINPKFGLKRMVFLVKNRSGPSTTEKAMITYSHYTPSSPEVMQLAYKIANFSSAKSHQYFPEEIRHLLDGEKPQYYPSQVARKDESIVLKTPELEAQIKEAQKRRRKELTKQKRMEDRARKAQNVEVETALSKKTDDTEGAASHTKRARLASLNDKNQRLRRAPLQEADADFIDDDNEEQQNEDPSAAAIELSGGISFTWPHPGLAPVVDGTADYEQESSSETEESDDGSSDSPVGEAPNSPVNGHAPPLSMYTPEAAGYNNNTVSAEPENTEPPSENTSQIERPTDTSDVTRKGKKRVRIADLSTQRAQKRARHSIANTTAAPSAETERTLSIASDASSSYEAEEESNEDEEVPQTQKRRRIFAGRQRGRPGPPPTLLERLTGLTGDPNDPIYQPPIRKERVGGNAKPWDQRKKDRINQTRKERKYVEVLDPVDKFNKLCCTLVIASSMSGEDGLVDWSIVENVYSSDNFFDVARTKKLWTWMKSNMATQLDELTTKFQASFLEAYPDGKVAAIDDPETYDWAYLVRWSMRHGWYPETPLPVYREALRHFVVDESSYESLDRVNWYQKKMANRVRTELQLHYTFTAPLHQPRRSDPSPDDQVLKARSWVRANTATPQALYSGKQAHDKFKALSTPVLTSVVGDYVEHKSLRMRKIKRLLPGRNYTFTKVFAKKYVRPFEPTDFMDAVQVKKAMDKAFAEQDPEDQHFNISRCEPDGSVMAILGLVSERKVKLVPQLPSVDNEFGAPLPRLSVWGFGEGNYSTRAMDRGRFFWDVHVLPTAAYEFGSPLQQVSSPLEQPDIGEFSEWQPLPDPPLPGKDDPEALLPIWSSIDGQSVTWPWWYRILNLVLQPLIFRPGAMVADIYAHCATHTTEMFEIELVLQWLESINGVSKTHGEGYITKPGIWAAFGDKLIDTDDDWIGEHVKRKVKKQEQQRWREEYNQKLSSLQQGHAQQADYGDLAQEENDHVLDEATRNQILQNPKRQYGIMQRVLDSQTLQPENGISELGASSDPVATTEGQAENEEATGAEEARSSVLQTPEIQDTPSQDVEMTDVEDNDVNVEGQVDDVDAEGEVDDAMY